MHDGGLLKLLALLRPLKISFGNAIPGPEKGVPADACLWTFWNTFLRLGGCKDGPPSVACPTAHGCHHRFPKMGCVLLQCFHASPFSVTCIGMTTRSGYHILILIFFFWSDSIYLYIFKHFQLFLFLKLLNFIKNKYNLFII